MDSMRLDRRTFLAASGMAVLAASGGWAEPEVKPVRIGVVGVGGRGTGLLNVLLSLPGTTVPAICDINEEHLNNALSIVRDARGATPEGYSKGPHDYRRMLERDDLDGVLVATPPEWHTPMAVDTMKSGKPVATEVPGAQTLDECWALVKTKEKTGQHYMLLENYCYACERMMVWNMIQKGMLGEPYYAECSYIHDCNSLRFNADGSLTWRGEAMKKGPGNVYPTHSLGPVSKWMDINHGDRFVSLTSMMSKPAGLNAYVKKKFGADSEQAKIHWNCAGMSVTLIRTEKERLITVYYDATSPRPMSIFYLVQGTAGVFDSRKGISIEDVTPAEEWLPWQRFHDEHGHDYWKTREAEATKTGHGGGDYFVISDFVDMVRQNREPWIDVYDSASWSAVMPLSQESVRKGGAEVHFPNFTAKRA